MEPPFAMEEQSLDARTCVVAVEGEIDIAVSPRLRRRLIDLVRDGKTRLVVDLSDVSFIDASAIETLVAVHVRLARGDRGHLAVVCGRSEVYRIFELTGLHSVLAFYSSTEEALAALRAPEG